MKSFFRFINYVLLSCGFVVLTGCPYSSSVPITETGIDIPKNFIGKWAKVGVLNSEKDIDYCELVAKDKKKFLLLDITKSYDGSIDTTVFEGHFSSIKGTLFMNTKMMKDPNEPTDPYENIEEDEGKYAYKLFRVRPFRGHYRLDELSKEIEEKFNSSAELYKFIEKNMNNDIFYNDLNYSSDTYIKL